MGFRFQFAHPFAPLSESQLCDSDEGVRVEVRRGVRGGVRGAPVHKAVGGEGDEVIDVGVAAEEDAAGKHQGGTNEGSQE